MSRIIQMYRLWLNGLSYMDYMDPDVLCSQKGR